MKRLRLKAFTRSDFSGYQLLQERRWWGWKTIDREDVPAHVRICVATCGDTGGWKSKFADKPVWA